MHIPSLVKIHWCLLKLSSGNEKRTDGRADTRMSNVKPQYPTTIMWQGTKIEVGMAAYIIQHDKG